MYCLKLADNTVKKLVKGLKRNVVDKVIGFDNYKAALDGCFSFVEMMAIRSNCHKIETDVIIKSGLCNFDDKRYYYDGFDTFALGYKMSDSIDFKQGGLFRLVIAVIHVNFMTMLDIVNFCVKNK